MSSHDLSTHRVVIELRWSRGLAVALALTLALPILAVSGLLSGLAAHSGTSPASVALSAPTTLAYQGQVKVNGLPFGGSGQFKFAIVSSDGLTALWTNDGTSLGSAPFQPANSVNLTVTTGLFNVLLGDTTLPHMTQPITSGVFLQAGRALRVWFNDGVTGFQQLAPDVTLAAVPYALNAQTLDGLDSTAFAPVVHTHSGADITSGTLADARLSGNVVLGGQGVSRLSNDLGYLTTAGAGAAGFITQTLADGRYALTIHTHSGADIVTGTIADARLSGNVVLGGQGVSRLSNDAGYLTTAGAGAAGFITQTLADGRYALTIHTHAGADIVTGTIADARLSGNVVLSSQGVSRLTNDAGYLTQGAADARYARLSPTTQQIALLKWYAAANGAQDTFTAGGSPWGIAFDGANMWVTNEGLSGGGNTVSVLRASDGLHVMTPTVGSHPFGIAFDGANMWVINNSDDTVSVLRASDGFHVMTPTVGSSPNGIAFDGVNMWATNFNDSTASVLRANDGFHVLTPTVGTNPVGIAFDGANMWVINSASNTVSVLRASDGFHVMTSTVGANPAFIAFDGTKMWVTNYVDNTLSVLRTSDGFHVITPTVGVNPLGIAFDGAFMWIANQSDNTVSKR